MTMNRGQINLKAGRMVKFDRLSTQENGHLDSSEFIQLTNTNGNGFHNGKEIYMDPDKRNAENEQDSDDMDSRCSGLRSNLLPLRRPAVISVLLLGVWVYLGFVLYLNPGKSVFVCILAPFVTLYLVNHLTKGKLWKLLRKLRKVAGRRMTPRKSVAVWIRR